MSLNLFPCLPTPGRLQPEWVGRPGIGEGVPSPAQQGGRCPGARARPDTEPATARPQLLANAVVFLCGNLTGAFHKHQMQDASRDLFTYTVKCIQIRRKLRIEKRQQVGPAWPCPAPWLSPGPHALHPFSEDVLTERHGEAPGAPGQTPVLVSSRGLLGTREGVCLPGW